MDGQASGRIRDKVVAGSCILQEDRGHTGDVAAHRDGAAALHVQRVRPAATNDRRADRRGGCEIGVSTAATKDRLAGSAKIDRVAACAQIDHVVVVGAVHHRRCRLRIGRCRRQIQCQAGAVPQEDVWFSTRLAFRRIHHLDVRQHRRRGQVEDAAPLQHQCVQPAAAIDLLPRAQYPCRRHENIVACATGDADGIARWQHQCRRCIELDADITVRVVEPDRAPGRYFQHIAGRAVAQDLNAGGGSGCQHVQRSG